MRHQQEKTIDGFSYKVTQLPASTSLRTFIKISKLIGPTIAGLIEGAVSEEKDAKETIMKAFDENLTTTVANLFDKINEEEIIDMIKMFADCTFVNLGNGKEPLLSGIFEEHFRGRIFSMFKFFVFALKVNYSDFLTGSSAMTAVNPSMED